jgi:anti-sigma regulatory factor (Ser/Thr protein kinase)
MSGPTSIRHEELALSCRLASVPQGRHFVRDTLLRWDLARLVEDAELGVSELIANAIRYARTDVTLTITAGDEVRISVADRDPMLHRPIRHVEQDVLAESGRGLRIVATVADDWGIESQAGGKAVWFTLALPDASVADAELHALLQPTSLAARRGRSGSDTAVVG